MVSAWDVLAALGLGEQLVAVLLELKFAVASSASLVLDENAKAANGEAKVEDWSDAVGGYISALVIEVSSPQSAVDAAVGLLEPVNNRHGVAGCVVLL